VAGELGVLTISEFNGTLKLIKPSDKLAPGDLHFAENVVLDKISGTISLAPGYTQLSGSALSQTSVHSLIRRGATRYQGAGSEFYRGFGTAIKTGLNGNRLSLVNYGDGKANDWTFIVGGGDELKDDGTNLRNFGIAAPTFTASIADGGSGNISSTNSYKITYKSSVTGHESNPSPVTADLAISSKNIDISGMTASGDAQVDKKRIYRTDLTISTWNFVAEIADSATTYTDNIAVASLGDAIEIDNNVPGAFTILTGPVFNRLFAAGLVGNLLRWSKPYEDGKSRGECWPALFELEVGSLEDTIVDLITAFGTLIIPCAESWYRLSGTTTKTFNIVNTRAHRGLAAYRAWAMTPGGVMFLGLDGLYVFDGLRTVPIYESLRPLFRNETVNSVTPLNMEQISKCRMASYGDFVYLSYPSGTGTNNDKVIRFHMSQEQATQLDWDAESIYHEPIADVLTFGDRSGKVYQETGFQANGSNQSYQAQTGDLRDTNDPLTLFRVKRIVKILIDYETGGTNLTLDIIGDGTSIKTYTLSTSSRTKETLDPPNDARGIRIRAKFTGTSSADFSLYGLTILYELGEIKFG